MENEHIYEKEAAETVRNNVYVDELLKSAADEQNAVHLIKKVKSMSLESQGFKFSQQQ